MLTLEQFQKVKRVIVHGGSCPDGRASAMIVNDAFRLMYGPSHDVRIEFVMHSSREHDALEPEPGMLFVDFSVPHDKADAFLEVGTIILDHHRGPKLPDSSKYSNKEVVQRFVGAGQGVFGDEVEEPGVCGALLAYEHVWKPVCESWAQDVYDSEVVFRRMDTIVQPFATLAGVRDTWLTDHPDWVKACKQAQALQFWPEEHLLRVPITEWESLMDIGDILWQKRCQTVQKVSKKTYPHTSLKGTRLGILQGTRLSSDIAEVLGDTVDLVLTYDFVHEDGVLKLSVSTRSHTGYNCASFCGHYRGGGHTAAAGCHLIVDISADPNPYKMLIEAVDAYESLS